ncbi:uncharacterized protein LOC132049028 [Lycium ferocissimum]|uniref:uncharacterized protein LOC132049028 n=1 Tax=Lycium ferocissimum TaxID=112874 RepID=UPI0028159745|nr:uncharacterized protein LOC132049028 [Lycium ferocissimum]
MAFVTWRILHRKIPTDDMILKLGIRSDLKCHCCRIAQPENIFHIFVNGPLALASWSHFRGFGISGSFNFIQEALNTWWSITLCNPISAMVVRICPIVLIWVLWTTRCNGRFGKKKPYLPKLLYQISHSITSIIRLQFLNFKYNLSWEELTHLLDKKIAFKMCRAVYWNKPTSNFFKINSDRSHKNNSSGGGGVIRNSQGKMIMAYSIHFGPGTSNIVEAKALLFGVQWCIHHNITNLELETDSILLMSWIKDVFKIPWQVDKIIRDIRRSLEGTFWSIQHCFHEANKVADLLAAMSHNTHMDRVYTNFEDLPRQVKGLVNMDKWVPPNFRIRNKKIKEIKYSDVVPHL